MAKTGSLEQQFNYCENVIEDLLKDRLGDSRSVHRNEKLRSCIQTLQSITDAIEEMALFSTNDVADELPTATLRYLLVPAYMGCALQETNAGKDKRKAYLRAAKSHFREYLQNLMIFELISFKLPWLDSENQGEGNSGINAHLINSLEDAVARRQQKIARLQQLKHLEEALERLRIGQKHDDEAEQRELILTLLRLWSVRAMKELDIIEEELRMLEKFETSESHGSDDRFILADRPSNSVAQEIRLKPFIIAKSEQQKKVFGLGYPSIPTVTVDQWFDQMHKSGGFGQKANPTSFTIDKVKRRDHSGEDEEDEEKRQAQIRRDEWKDWNPRGSGNTYNKG